MAFVFNLYQCGDAANTPPRPRPKTAARPLPALLPPGDWSEPTRRRRRDDPADAGGRRGRSHSPRRRRRRNSRFPKQVAPPSPHRSRLGSRPRPKTPSPSVPPGNFHPPRNFQAPGPAFFRGPQVFVPPQTHEPPRAPMAPGHPWPPPPMRQFRQRPEPVHQAPPAPRPMQTPGPGHARDARPAQNKGPRRPAVPKTPPQQKTADELLDNLLRSLPNVNSCMYFFKVKDFPGPPPTPGQAYAWAHCSDQKGTVGILSMGRVLRAAAYTLGLAYDQEAMSFFGRVHTNPTWTDNFVEWCANLTWSTKNSSGIVFGGYLSGNVSKSPSANTQLESSLCRLHPAVHSISRDKCWAIRECAARIDFICVAADSTSADFPSPPVLQRIADAVAQRRIEDGEAWGSHWPAD